MFVFGYFLMKNIKCYAEHKRKWTSLGFIHWGPIMENFWIEKKQASAGQWDLFSCCGDAPGTY